MTAQGNPNIRPMTLTAAQAGMSRMRPRGGASPDTLYDLENGFISPSKAPTQRPGTRFFLTLPPNTKGLCSFNGTLHTFKSGNDSNPVDAILPPPEFGLSANTGGSLSAGACSYRISALNIWGEGTVSEPIVINVPAGSRVTISWNPVPNALSYRIYGRTPGRELLMQVVSGVTSFVDTGGGAPPSGPPPPNLFFAVDTLRHPDPAFIGQIKKIHFAAPFMGCLYVVAEFDDNQIFHYYLRSPEAWNPNKQYLNGDLVQPRIATGYYYKAAPKQTPQAWAPSVKRALGDVVQPTTANGFKYTVTNTAGGNPSSGAVEPTWPKLSGAIVREFAESDGTPAPPAAPPAPAPSPPAGYDNPGGAAPPRGGGGGGLGGSRYPIAQN